MAQTAAGTINGKTTEGAPKGSSATTVREATFELFRARGMTTIFGNPGSTELPMLADFPEDFRYVLGLQEAVVVGMADGYAQASGRGRRTSTSTRRPGVGNAMGAIFNAQANKSPLLVTAGQQVRAHMTMQANLTNRDADAGPAPVRQVELRAAARAGRPGRARARDPPRRAAAARARRSCRSRWTTGRVEIDAGDVAPGDRAPVSGRAGADPEAVARARRAARARPQRPVLVAGPDVDASRRLGAGGRARRAPAPARLGDARRRAAAGSASPRTTRTSRACCRRRSGRSAQTLEEHDLVLVAGSSVFPYYPYIPGAAAARGRRAGRDHRATPTRPRARRWATRSSPTSRSRSRRCSAEVGESDRGRRPSRSATRRRAEDSRPARPRRRARDARRGAPRRRRSSCSSRPSSTLALRNRLRISRPGSYYFGAGGGLGLRPRRRRSACSSPSPSRPVVCVLGEGSAQYAITGFWTAAAYEVPVTFLVLRNEEYAILKWFAELEQVDGRARARPARARRRGDRRRLRRRRRDACAGRDELREALAQALAADAPAARRGRRRARACRCSDRCATLLAPDRAASAAAGAPSPTARPTARGRHARAAARASSSALLGADRVLHARARPRPLRLRREPLPAASRRRS